MGFPGRFCYSKAMTDSAAGFIAFRNTIQSPALRAIADHWDEARGTRRLPSWDRLKPSRLGEHLSSAWAFDYDRGANLFTGRLAGSNIMVGIGKSFQGILLSDLHKPETFALVQAYLQLHRLAASLLRQQRDLHAVRESEPLRAGLEIRGRRLE